MTQSIKDLFKRLLIGYISKGHTVSDSSQKEVERLTDIYVKNLFIDECFTARAVEVYCWYMDENLCDEFACLYSLHFKYRYYTEILETYMKYVLRERAKDKGKIIESNDESEDSNDFEDVDSDGFCNR